MEQQSTVGSPSVERLVSTTSYDVGCVTATPREVCKFITSGIVFLGMVSDGADVRLL